MNTFTHADLDAQREAQKVSDMFSDDPEITTYHRTQALDLIAIERPADVLDFLDRSTWFKEHVLEILDKCPKFRKEMLESELVTEKAQKVAEKEFVRRPW